VPSIPDRQCFAEAAVRCGFGPVHVQPWINQPLAPFFNVNVICAASRIAISIDAAMSTRWWAGRRQHTEVVSILRRHDADPA
jgi:hypothetical protein